MRKTVRTTSDFRNRESAATAPSPGVLEHWMVVRLFLALALTLALAVMVPRLGAQEVSLPVGTPAPAAALEDLDGNAVQLLDYAKPGKPAVIEFWASWCHECEALEPEMDRVQEAFGNQVNVVAVAVAVSQSQRRVKRHVEKNASRHAFLWDGEGNAVRNYKVPGTSVVVILDAEGKVAYTGSGPDQDLMGIVEKILGN